MMFKSLHFAALVAAVAQFAAGSPVANVTTRAAANTGQGTWYFSDGFGACGDPITSSEFVVAVGAGLYDSQSVCNRRLTATYQGRSVTVTVKDRCAGCAFFDLDFSPVAFDQLADRSVGRISGVNWNFI